MKNKRTIFT